MTLTPPSFARRLVYAVLATALVLSVTAGYRFSTNWTGNDLQFPFCGAQALLHGQDPYDNAVCPMNSPGGKIWPTNPLTTVVALLPVYPLGYTWGTLLLWSSFTGLYVFGLSRTGQWWRLLALLSYPYYETFLYLQWAPLLLALSFVPTLAPLALVKPHTGLPIILTHLTLRRLLLCGLFGMATLALDPTWPLRWLPQTTARYSNGYVPFLVFGVGLLLPLAWLRWRDKRAQFLGLMALLPQRGLYDLLALWALVETPGQMVLLTALSWVPLGVWTLGIPLAYPFLAVLTTYLPLLLMILVQSGQWRVQSPKMPSLSTRPYSLATGGGGSA